MAGTEQPCREHGGHRHTVPPAATSRGDYVLPLAERLRLDVTVLETVKRVCLRREAMEAARVVMQVCDDLLDIAASLEMRDKPTAARTRTAEIHYEAAQSRLRAAKLEEHAAEIRRNAAEAEAQYQAKRLLALPAEAQP